MLLYGVLHRDIVSVRIEPQAVASCKAIVEAGSRNSRTVKSDGDPVQYAVRLIRKPFALDISVGRIVSERKEEHSNSLFLMRAYVKIFIGYITLDYLS